MPLSHHLPAALRHCPPALMLMDWPLFFPPHLHAVINLQGLFIEDRHGLEVGWVAAGPRMSTHPEDDHRGCLNARCYRPPPPPPPAHLGYQCRVQCLSLQPEDNLSHLKTPKKIQSRPTLPSAAAMTYFTTRPIFSPPTASSSPCLLLYFTG